MTNPYESFIPEELRLESEPLSRFVSIDRFELRVLELARPHASARVLVLHGGGGHAAALWPLAAATGGVDVELLAVDLPGFGRTRVPRGHAVSYGDWVTAATELVDREAARDERPLILLGASMGGMLAFDVAGRTGAPAAVVATCLLDPRDHAVRVGTARTRWLGEVGARTMPCARPLDRLRVPMRLVADMRSVANDPRLATVCAADPLGGGTSVPIRFLRTWFASAPAVAPEDFDVCPVVLAHPAQDRWTPVALSRPFLDRIAAPTRVIMLEGAGHFPVERPGIDQLAQAVRGAVPAAV